MPSSVRRTLALAAVAVALVSPAVLSAQVVSNGGFENGNAAWSFQANDCAGTVGDPNAGPSYTGTTTAAGTYARPHNGASDLWMGAAGCTPAVSQSLATVSGQQYELSFWTKVNGALNNVPNRLTVVFNSTTLLDAQMSDTAWKQMVFNVTATGDDQVLFAANNTYGGTELDDVSLTHVSVTSEPRTTLLLATGLAGLVPVLRRKRR